MSGRMHGTAARGERTPADDRARQAAARLKVDVDKRLKQVTPAWIVALAEEQLPDRWADSAPTQAAQAQRTAETS